MASLSSTTAGLRVMSSALGRRTMSSLMTSHPISGATVVGSNVVLSSRDFRASRPKQVIKSPLPDVEIPVMPINEFVFRDVKKYSDRLALINGLTGKAYTYAQTRDAVWRLASGLARIGVKQGDVVMIVSENSVEYILLYHAVLSLGAVNTMANPIYLTNDIINQAKDSNTKFIVGSQRFISKTMDVANALPQQIKKTIVIGDESGCVPFTALLSDDGSMYPSDVKFDPRTQLALLPYSSGTTGMPKGVMLSHFAEVANTCQFDSDVFFKERDGAIQLGLLPFYHIYSIIASFMSSFAWGQTTVVVPGFDPRLFLEVVPKYKINMTFAVPPIIMFLNKHPMAAKADLSSLKRIVNGAAALSAEMVEEFRSKHPECVVGQGYGMTETAPVITCTPINSSLTKPGSAGIPIANTEMKIVDTMTGEECKNGDHGEICARGPQLMLGYLNNPKATAEMIDSEGWLHTGDIGYLDEDDHLYISDRLKELIKYKGLQVPPAELEAVLCNHPAIADAGVIGVPDVDGGEIPRAYVALKQGAAVSAKELQKYVNDHVVAYKRLRGGIEFLPEIPRSAAGKILRRQLKEVAKHPNVDTSTFSPLMME